jgi:hypothetical protein
MGMLGQVGLGVGIFGKATVNASPRKHVVVPPFCKKPFAASRALEPLKSDARNQIERYPAKRGDKYWCGALE